MMGIMSLILHSRLKLILLLLCVTAPCASAYSPIRPISVALQRSIRRLPNSAPLSASLPALPLVAPSDTWGNLAVLTGTATLAQNVGTSTAIGRLLGPPVSAMAIAFSLASIGVLQPGGTAAAKTLQLLSFQLATPLLLLGTDVRNCAAQCGPLLGSFLLATLATVLACSVAWGICGGLLSTALGQKDSIIIAAALLAKNIGGGINYIAVCRCLQASPEAVAAGLCVDNLFGLLYFPVSSALSAGRPDLDNDCADGHEKSVPMVTDLPISVQQLSIVATIAATMIWLGERLGGATGALPVCTLLTVLLASLSPLRWIQPLQPAAHIMGSFFLYLFFATVGAPGLAVADSVKHSILPLGLYNILLYGIHSLILWWIAKICRDRGFASPQRLLIGSSAAIGGPTTAAALAQANGWKSLVAPSLLVGNIGYAIATFVALGYHAIFSR